METLTDINQVRVWIYRSIKKLSPELEAEILEKGKGFIGEWASHGAKLNSDFKILNHHFLVFFVDQNFESASGCSIDTSVAFIREIEAKHQLGLLDRQKMAFLKEEEVVLFDFNQLKQVYDEGIISDATPIFDPLVQNKAEFDHRFLSPFSESPYFRTIH